MFNFLSRELIHDPLASPTPTADIEVRTIACYVCAYRCSIRAHLRDGEVRHIDGNSTHPLNHGGICAKGSFGIMNQVSPEWLTQPILRKAGSERGAGNFEPIGWERAFDMQAVTGQFDTPNYTAQDGFCSEKSAAAFALAALLLHWATSGTRRRPPCTRSRCGCPASWPNADSSPRRRSIRRTSTSRLCPITGSQGI
ncbi:hypothetical protein C7T35_10380 [Variovorax sp. WS11]|nr:hypothetical protein [Variovorax sp. WS11]PSL84695.1 hypothetical protein C7T35_10380 [Variovorax sp. WS11]